MLDHFLQFPLYHFYAYLKSFFRHDKQSYFIISGDSVIRSPVGLFFFLFFFFPARSSSVFYGGFSGIIIIIMRMFDYFMFIDLQISLLEIFLRSWREGGCCFISMWSLASSHFLEIGPPTRHLCFCLVCTMVASGLAGALFPVSLSLQCGEGLLTDSKLGRTWAFSSAAVWRNP